MRNSILFFFFILVSATLPCDGQVATAPFSPDQRLLNPSLAPFRKFRGHSISLERETDSAKVVGTTTTIDTTIDTISIGGALSRGDFFYEINLLPQFGSRTSKSNFTDLNDQSAGGEFKRNITLVPVQAIASVRLADWAGVGLKILGTYAGFSTNDQSSYRFGNTVETSNTVGSRTDLFLSPGLGGIIRFGGFFIGGNYELMIFKDKEDSNISTTSQDSSSTRTVETTRNKSGTTHLQKNILGAGYTQKFLSNNTFRVEISQERMPTLLPGFIDDGMLERLVIESTWSYFQLGLELTKQKGYYIDAYNLIPYFFNTSDLTNDEVIQYRFFGGFKTSKGHSFGISYSQFSKVKQEAMAEFGNTVAVSHSYSSYGLSYMFVY